MQGGRLGFEDSFAVGFGMGSELFFHPAFHVWGAGKRAYGQHANDGFPKAMAYATAASLGSIPGAVLGTLRRFGFYNRAVFNEMSPVPAYLGMGMAGLNLAVGVGMTRGGINRLSRKRWLTGGLMLGFGLYSLYSGYRAGLYTYDIINKRFGGKV